LPLSTIFLLDFGTFHFVSHFIADNGNGS